MNALKSAFAKVANHFVSSDESPRSMSQGFRAAIMLVAVGAALTVASPVQAQDVQAPNASAVASQFFDGLKTSASAIGAGLKAGFEAGKQAVSEVADAAGTKIADQGHAVAESYRAQPDDFLLTDRYVEHLQTVATAAVRDAKKNPAEYTVKRLDGGFKKVEVKDIGTMHVDAKGRLSDYKGQPAFSRPDGHMEHYQAGRLAPPKGSSVVSINKDGVETHMKKDGSLEVMAPVSDLSFKPVSL